MVEASSSPVDDDPNRSCDSSQVSRTPSHGLRSSASQDFEIRRVYSAFLREWAWLPAATRELQVAVSCSGPRRRWVARPAWS